MAAGDKIKKIEENIGALETEYGSRTFSYDPESDTGYQNYLKLMQDNGKKAMEDTVGKASALTGGYANSYAASAGQQVYNDFMKQGAEAQAGFRQLYRDEWDAKNQDILNQLSLLKEQKKSIWDDAALKASYGDLTGYTEDLGLTNEQVAGMVGKTAPTAEQIAYAKTVYKNGGMEKLLEYKGSLAGIDGDALIKAVNDDAEIKNTKYGLMDNFEVVDYGGANWLGLNKNAELNLNGKIKTAQEWYETLTDKDGKYNLSKEDAKEIMKKLGVHA